MSRFRILAMATLLAIPVVGACDDDTVAPAAAGALAGQVAIGGQGIDGVTVTLDNGEADTTAQGGAYRLEGIKAGTYTIMIDDFPEDAIFDATSMSATLAADIEEVKVDFKGSWIRTSSITGAVSVGNDGLGGVTVKISGVSQSEILTGADGQFAFTGLRAGDYAIEISGFDPEIVAFESTSSEAAVAMGEWKVVDFAGTDLRTSAIMGQVKVEDNPLEGVTVRLVGGGEDRTETTDGVGQYSFDDLQSGAYSVGISGYDTVAYGFDTTSRSLTVASEETERADFNGVMLQTAGISGQVSVDGTALGGVTVTLSGEVDRNDTTDGQGRFRFLVLPAGEYTISISGYDENEYEFGSSQDIALGLDESGIANFIGRSLRTVVVMGAVMAEGEPLAGGSVTLLQMVGGNVAEPLGAMATREDGGYRFDGLLAGTYRVEIFNFDEEFDFADTRWQGAVRTDETATVDFHATIIRSASLSGTVTVDGDGVAGVMVTLTGEHARDGSSIETGSDGGYSYVGLRKGSYNVMMTNPDAVMYDFPNTSRSVSLSLGQALGDVSFAGTRVGPVIAQRALLVWGGVDANGVPHLDPSFVLDGSPYLPESDGPHQIAGREADGAELFSFRFEMPVVADGDGSSGFVFFLPAREEWADRLASITLSGPGGSFTLDRDSDEPMAILRNPESGQIRQIVRDLPPGPEAREIAERLAAETGFELFFSRGIPDPADWRR